MSDSSDVDLLRRALRLDDDDVINSSEESEVERDWIKGLAQRFIDPYYKERKAKGTFLYMKKANQQGRHIYLNEEIERIKWERDEAKVKAMLATGQFKVSGVIDFMGGTDPSQAHLSINKLEPLDASTPDNAMDAPQPASTRHVDDDEKRTKSRRSRGSRRSKATSSESSGSERPRRQHSNSRRHGSRSPSRRHRRHGSRRRSDATNDADDDAAAVRRRDRRAKSRRRDSRDHTRDEQRHRSRTGDRRHGGDTEDDGSPDKPSGRRRTRRSKPPGDSSASPSPPARRHGSRRKPSGRSRDVEDERSRRRVPRATSPDTRAERARRARAQGPERRRRAHGPARTSDEDTSGPRPPGDASKGRKKGWTELQEEKANAPHRHVKSPSAAVADDDVVKGNEAQNIYGIARNRQATVWDSDDDSEPEEAKERRRAERAAARAAAEAEKEAQGNALEAAFNDEEDKPEVWIPPEERTEEQEDAQDKALLAEMSAVSPPASVKDEPVKLKPLPVQPEDDEEEVAVTPAASGSPKEHRGSPKSAGTSLPPTGSPQSAPPVSEAATAPPTESLPAASSSAAAAASLAPGYAAQTARGSDASGLASLPDASSSAAQAASLAPSFAQK